MVKVPPHAIPEEGETINFVGLDTSAPCVSLRGRVTRVVHQPGQHPSLKVIIS